jgi:hypothetical protein
MKTLYATLILFTIGFMLINGHRNLLCGLFVMFLLALFIVLPVCIRLKHFVRTLNNIPSLHEHWT